MDVSRAVYGVRIGDEAVGCADGSRGGVSGTRVVGGALGEGGVEERCRGADIVIGRVGVGAAGVDAKGVVLAGRVCWVGLSTSSSSRAVHNSMRLPRAH